MRFAFCTCVQLGKSCLEVALLAGHKFDLLITLRNEKARRKSGRIYLDDLAERFEIPLLKIDHINDAEVSDRLREEAIDWLFLIGWSQIAGQGVLSAPRQGIVGAHPTLLPEGRGRAAIPWAILKGLEKTGVSFFRMDEGVDTGPLLGQWEIPIGPEETATTLYKKVDEAHVKLMLDLMPQLEEGRIQPVFQDVSQATYWEGRTPKDGELFPSMTVHQVDLLVRATTHPYPGAYIVEGDRKIFIWEGEIGRKGNCTFMFADGWYSALDYSEETLDR